MPVQYVENIMSKNVIDAHPKTTLSEIFRLLSAKKISFVVISKNHRPVGVITERDIVNITARKVDISTQIAESVMSQPVVVLKGTNIDISEAYHRLKMENKRHLVVVDSNEMIIGVVTITDFIKHLGIEAFIEHKPLKKIMSAKLLTCTPDTALIDAIDLMSKNMVSSMIMVEDDKPVGILTERDIAQIRADGIHDLETTPVSTVMSTPLVTAPPQMNTFDASKMMEEKKLRHLVVVDDDGKAIGVVTETNIILGMEGRYVRSLIELLDAKDAQLRAINADLENRVHQRTQELTREIEAHKLAQQAMEKLTQALKQAGEAVIITDAKGFIEYINDSFAETTGYELRDVVGKNPSMLQSGRMDKSFYKLMWESLNSKGFWQGVIWNKRKNGDIYPEQLHIRSITDDEGKILNYIGTFSDITEKLAMEKERRHTQKMEAIGTLVGGVAHNFNNILAGMVGNLFLVREEAGACPEIIPFLDSLDQMSDHAADIVRQLLTFARKEFSVKSNFSLNKIVKEAVNTSRLGIPEDIQLLADLESEEMVMHGDPTMIQQVVMNIISNARDAMTEASPRMISVSLRCEGNDSRFESASGCARITIEDSGSGISKADMENIFEPFYTTKEAGKGTGLGLSMSKGAIESHGGLIEVETTLGKGTEFHIYLPLIAKKEFIEATNDTTTTMKGNGELILLVDDEDIVLKTVKSVLLALGYNVLTAHDGTDALTIYEEKKKHISVVITDIIMPRMGGYTLAKEIRKNSDVPIVFLTGYDFEMSKVEIDSMSTTIPKPCNVHELSRVLYDFLKL